MPSDATFIDTVALQALVNPRDALHRKAADGLRRLGRERVPLVTSDWC